MIAVITWPSAKGDLRNAQEQAFEKNGTVETASGRISLWFQGLMFLVALEITLSARPQGIILKTWCPKIFDHPAHGRRHITSPLQLVRKPTSCLISCPLTVCLEGIVEESMHLMPIGRWGIDQLLTCSSNGQPAGFPFGLGTDATNASWRRTAAPRPTFPHLTKSHGEPVRL